MSYEIEYSKRAFKAHDATYNDEVYFAFITTASNNVDPRVPSPMLIGTGMRWEIISKVCVMASSCESGCLKPNNRKCTPESYIRRWREVLKNAPSLEEYLNHNRLSLKLTMKHDELKLYLASIPDNPNPDKWRWDRIRELLEPLHLSDVYTWFSANHTFVEIPVKSYEDIKRAVELEHLLKEASLLCWNIQIEGVR